MKIERHDRMLAVLCVGMLVRPAAAGLRDHTPAGFRMGSQVTASILADTFPYHEIVRWEFNIVCDDRFKMATMQPSEGVFSFAASDTLVNWALSNGMAVRGHTLVYDKSVPQWIVTKSASWTREEAIAILSNHIVTVVSHFRGRVKYYDVVNEIVNDSGGMASTFWGNQIGAEYVDLAFAWAHAADPEAALFWNEQRCEGLNTKSAAMVTHLQNARGRGVPVHGFGTQAHVVLGDYTASGAAITSNLNRFAALGLETQITECDVRIYADDGVTRAEILQQQRDYENIVRACLAASNCTAFVMWGFSDYYSWIPNNKPGYDAACIYDKALWRKPAYFGVRNALVPVAAEFRFDETGAWCTNSGRDAALLRLSATNGVATDAHTAEGGGVSGRPYDWALDTRGGTVAGVATGITALAGADSCTLAAWYRFEQKPAGEACLVRLQAGSNDLALSVRGDGTLRLRRNGEAVDAGAAVPATTAQWVFVAASYDGGSAASNVAFYAGLRTGVLWRVGVATLPTGGLNMTSATLYAGAALHDGSEALCGQADCVRVMAAAGAAGAVEHEALDAMRRDDSAQRLPALLVYAFDESGSAAACGGFLPYQVALRNSAGSSTDLHSADGGGISQLLGDRAFDNTAAGGMGLGFTGGRAEHAYDETPLDRLVSFTFCGWFKPEVAVQNSAVLLHNQETSGAGYSITAAAGAQSRDVAVNVDGLTWRSTGGRFDESNMWVFVAASYDGSRSANNVKIYQGGRMQPVQCVSEGTLDCGRTETDTTTLLLGGMSGGQQPFDGLMDDVRLYASKFDGSGVLGAAELEEIRALQAVAEPGWLGGAGAGALALAAWRAGRRGWWQHSAAWQRGMVY